LTADFLEVFRVMKRFRLEIVIGLLLVVAVFAAFGPALNNPFVEIDDHTYVSGNPHVLSGLTWPNVDWAFTTFHGCNWHPLTWLSLQADVTLFGPGPWGVHLTNLLLHAAAAVVLFLALRLMTGSIGRSAFVAAFFAVHPLRVESVAWAAERKDVLSGLFCMLTLLAYGWYAQRPSRGRYLLVLLAFTLGLLAKPMLVTLPCVLLLLDWWPLRRLAGTDRTAARFGALLWEKAPLFAVAAASCVVTVIAQQEATLSFASYGLGIRTEIAFVAYAAYLGKTFWPVDLAALYPYPMEGVPAWQVFAAVVLLLGITLAAWRLRTSEPPLLMGWLWFLGTLVPVIGLIQVGSQMMADRYTYLPCIGLGIALVWPAADLAARRQAEKVLAGMGMSLVVVALVVTWGQVHYWNDDRLLWERTLEVTGPKNPFAQDALGKAYTKRGVAEGNPELITAAVGHFELAIRAAPANAELHGNLGGALLNLGRRKEALEQLALAATGLPHHATIQHDLGVCLYQLGKVAEALPHFEAAIAAYAEFGLAYYRLGQCLCRQGSWDKGVDQLRKAVELQPEMVGFRIALACALSHQEKRKEADAEYIVATRMAPDWLEKHHREAWNRATSAAPETRCGVEGTDLAERLCDATSWKVPEYLMTLAAGYAAEGRFDAAAATARKALDAVPRSGDKKELADALRQQLALYERREALWLAPTATR
jgi:tetratricopeptide (TPR) repeat protein